jgi:hypothetical protein
MASDEWQWKNKDGGKPGLLYESGNWGDILKLLWVIECIKWKRERVGHVTYCDPFAGDVHYPLGRRTRYRLECTFPEGLDPLIRRFVDAGRWPSAASVALALVGDAAEVWDADPARRGNWREAPGVTVLDGQDGRELLPAGPSGPGTIWLLDPYDFMAEWRKWLPTVMEKARSTTVLLYLYNRSGGSEARFSQYRAFRGALEDARGVLPKRVGRVAADAFLPRSHHEMIFLPGGDDWGDGEGEQLMKRLASLCETVDNGLRRMGLCE